jgi:BRCA1-associated protein
MANLRTLVERLEQARLDDDTRRAVDLDERRRANDERHATAERERARAEQRAKVSTELARRLERELREERAVSSGLLANLSAAKAGAAAAEDARRAAAAEVTELQEQVRDVMFALELKSKIGEGGTMSEVEGGSVVVPPQPTPSAQSKGKRKGKK